MAGNNYGTIARANVLLVPKFDKLGKSIDNAVGGADTHSAGATLGSKLMDGIKSKLGGIGSKISEALGGIDMGALGGIGNALSGVGSAAMGAVKGVAVGATAAATAASAAVVAIGKSALDSYADFEQLSGGIETLFKDTAGEAMQNAQKAFKTAGMSANEYMETVTGFAGSLRQALGDENAWQMASYADEAVQDMSDNANKMGSDIKSIQNAYQGFAKQNFTMLDNLKLGYGGTKEEMERLLRDAEKIEGFEVGSLDVSNFADVVTAIHAVQTEMGITGTTAKEAATTISGSVSTMQGAWSNWLTELGKDNGDVAARTQELIDSVFGTGEDNPGVLGNILPRVIQIGETIAANMPMIMGRIGTAIEENLLPKLDELTGGKASEIYSAFKDLGDRVGKIFEDLKPHIDNLIDKLGPVLTDVILPALGSAFEVVGDTIGLVADIISGILQVIKDVTDAIKAASEAAQDFAAKNGGNAAQAGSYNTAPTYVQQPSGYNGGVHFASGGRVTGPTYALIGEAGYDEYVVPNTRSGMAPLASNLAQEITSQMARMRSGFRDDVEGLRIYLDGKTLVGGISQRMDRALVR